MLIHIFIGEKKMKSLYDILFYMADKLEIDPNAITSPSRKTVHVIPRHLFSFVALEEGYKSTKVAEFLNRDHSTILSSKKVAEDLMVTDSSFKSKYQSIKEGLNLL